MTSIIGRIIDGKYQILDKIGQGGMGEVYRARHVMMDRTVALKLLRFHLTEDEEALRRFQQEAKAASRIEHPNAVVIYDFGRADEGLCYIAMEYIEGVSLKQVLKDVGPMPAERAVPIIKQICSVLAEAHRHGVIHRDIKPENIMLCRKGNKDDVVKVLDFGIAKILKDEGSADMTKTGIVFGTPKYMSPEQIQGKQLDGRSDIYALGCVIYEMFTGRPPFEGDADLDLMLKHLHNDPKPMHETAPQVSVTSELEQVVLRALNKESEKRLSADELAHELDLAITVKMDRQQKPPAKTEAEPAPSQQPASSPLPVTVVAPSLSAFPATWTEKTSMGDVPAAPPAAAPVQPPIPTQRSSNILLPIIVILAFGVVIATTIGGYLYLRYRSHRGISSFLQGMTTPGQIQTPQQGQATGTQNANSTTGGAIEPPPTTLPTDNSTMPPVQQPNTENPNQKTIASMPRFQRLSNDAVKEVQNGRPEQAYRLFAEAIRQQPDSAELHFNLAQVFVIQRKNAEAIEELRLYLQYFPDAPDRSQVEEQIQELQEDVRSR